MVYIDNRSEFNFIKLKEEFRKHGFAFRTIVLKALKQNGPIERTG